MSKRDKDRARRRRRYPEINVPTPPVVGGNVCSCGKEISPVYEKQCEDCWVDAQVRWNGHSRRVKVFSHNG